MNHTTGELYEHDWASIYYALGMLIRAKLIRSSTFNRIMAKAPKGIINPELVDNKKFILVRQVRAYNNRHVN
jgi:hypothetical protein